MASIILCSPSMVMGGAERYLLNLSEGLIAEGNEVTVVLVEKEGELFHELDNKCHVISLNKGRVLKGIKALSKIFEQNSLDMIISFQTHMNVVVLAATLLAHKNIPVVITEHTPIAYHKKAETRLTTRVRELVLLTGAKLLYKKAFKLVGVSSGVAEDYAKMAGLSEDQVEIIPTPVITPKFLSQISQDPVHRWLRNKDKPVVVSVGRLDEVKDHVTLVKAFEQLRKKIDARLVIFGEGENRTALEELIKSCNLSLFVDLPGWETNPYREMAKADVYVQSSRLEGFGNVLIEAMACGVPVISTDCPVGPREILAGGEYGILTPVGDEIRLAEELYRVLNLSDVERKHIVDRGKTRARDFSLDLITKRYTDFL